VQIKLLSLLKQKHVWYRPRKVQSKDSRLKIMNLASIQSLLMSLATSEESLRIEPNTLNPHAPVPHPSPSPPSLPPNLKLHLNSPPPLHPLQPLHKLNPPLPRTQRIEQQHHTSRPPPAIILHAGREGLRGGVLDLAAGVGTAEGVVDFVGGVGEGFEGGVDLFGVGG